MAVLQIEFARCGFGASAGLVPEIRFGFVRVTMMSQSVVRHLQLNNEKLRGYRDALRDANRKWGRSTVRVSELEEDLRDAKAANQQLELDLCIAQAMSSRREEENVHQGLVIEDLSRKLAPFRKKRGRDSKGHFVADVECAP